MGALFAKHKRPQSNANVITSKKSRSTTRNTTDGKYQVVTIPDTTNVRSKDDTSKLCMSKQELNSDIGFTNTKDEINNIILRTYQCHQFSPLCVTNENVASTFVGQVKKLTPSTVCYLQRKQNSPDSIGSFWFRVGYDGAVRHDYAILRGWNNLSHTATLAVPKGIFMYEGIAASQQSSTEFLMGGGVQIYIPLIIVQALFPLSEAFLATPNRDDKIYARQCLPVLGIQTEWYDVYIAEKNIRSLEAKESNTLLSFKNKVDRILEADMNIAQKYMQLENIYFKIDKIVPTILTTEIKHRFNQFKLELNSRIQMFYTDLDSKCDGVLEDWTVDEYVTQETLHPTAWLYFNFFDDKIKHLLKQDTTVSITEPLPNNYLNTPFRAHKYRNSILYVTLIFINMETHVIDNETVYHYIYKYFTEWR